MDWHRHFGLLLTDFFTGSPFVVEPVKDLSHRKQLLDIVIVRKRPGQFAERLPDGLEDLVDHNLITFKSYREALDDWALKELTGHYVNYRKQLSENDEPLLPEDAFGLYAVCSRFPHNLAQQVPWATRQSGVYECQRGTDRIRVIVAGQLPQSEPNALLHLFSASAEQVRYGAEHFRQRSEDTSTFLQELVRGYQEEGVPMPYTVEDFRREYAKKYFKHLTPQEQQEAMQDVPPEQRLKDLTPEQRLKDLTPEQRLAGLTPEQIEQALAKLKAERGTPPSKKRRRK